MRKGEVYAPLYRPLASIVVVKTQQKFFRDATQGATPEVKAIGRRMLAYKLGHTVMAAGVLGMPLMNLVAMAMVIPDRLGPTLAPRARQAAAAASGTHTFLPSTAFSTPSTLSVTSRPLALTSFMRLCF